MNIEEARSINARIRTATKPKRSKSKDLEHIEQVKIFNHVRELIQSNQKQYKVLKLLHAIPNGGHRSKTQGAKLKAEGVRAGVADIFLPAARKGFNGLYIELKIKPNTQSKAQKEFMQEAREENYKYVLTWNYEETINEIMDYIK